MVQLTLGRDVGSKCLCCAHKLLSAPPWHSSEEGSWLCPSPPATPVGFFWELLHSSSSDRQGGCSRMCPNKQEFNRRLGKKKEKKPTHHKKHPTDKRKKNNPKPKGPKATPNHQQKQNPPKQKQKLNPTKITPPTNKLIISCLLKDTT